MMAIIYLGTWPRCYPMWHLIWVVGSHAFKKQVSFAWQSHMPPEGTVPVCCTTQKLCFIMLIGPVLLRWLIMSTVHKVTQYFSQWSLNLYTNETQNSTCAKLRPSITNMWHISCDVLNRFHIWCFSWVVTMNIKDKADCGHLHKSVFLFEIVTPDMGLDKHHTTVNSYMHWFTIYYRLSIYRGTI